MRILVTGTNGQLAQALKARGAAHGVELFAVGRPDLDITRADSIRAVADARNPDVIINAGAYTAVDRAEAEEVAAYAVNALGAAAVATVARDRAAPLIHISTDYVFDGEGDGARHEDDPVNPIGAYGRTKLAGEVAVRATTPDHAILRTSWLFSRFGQNFVKTMLRLAADRDDVRVVADQYGSPTHAIDLADAILTMSRNLVERRDDASLRGTFHAANSGFATWADVARVTFAASAAHGGPTAKVTNVPTTEYPTAARRPTNSRLSTGKLYERHGVKLPDWRDAVERCVAEILNNGSDTP